MLSGHADRWLLIVQFAYLKRERALVSEEKPQVPEEPQDVACEESQETPWEKSEEIPVEVEGIWQQLVSFSRASQLDSLAPSLSSPQPKRAANIHTD